MWQQKGGRKGENEGGTDFENLGPKKLCLFKITISSEVGNEYKSPC